METARGVLLKLRDVNPSHIDLTEKESDILRALLHERETFSCSGRWREAAAMGVAILIVWRRLMEPSADVPDTQAGDL